MDLFNFEFSVSETKPSQRKNKKPDSYDVSVN